MAKPELKDNLKNLLEIKNATDEEVELYIYGDIVSSWWGAWDNTDQYPESVKKFLEGADGKISTCISTLAEDLFSPG